MMYLCMVWIYCWVCKKNGMVRVVLLEFMLGCVFIV